MAIGSGMSHAVLDSSMLVGLATPSLCMQRAVTTGKVRYRGRGRSWRLSRPWLSSLCLSFLLLPPPSTVLLAGAGNMVNALLLRVRQEFMSS